MIYERMKSFDISWNLKDEGKLRVKTEKLRYEILDIKQGWVLVVLDVNYEG